MQIAVWERDWLLDSGPVIGTVTTMLSRKEEEVFGSFAASAASQPRETFRSLGYAEALKAGDSPPPFLESPVPLAAASTDTVQQPQGFQRQRNVIQSAAHISSSTTTKPFSALLMATAQPAVSQQSPIPTHTPLPVTSTPPPSSQQPSAATVAAAAAAVVNATAGAASSQFQRLKVEDALSYLDQVKLQFGNQPQVYNDFLDIMKEFKSQSIDTPGVISRVSNLFKGHPDLIVGFNTFLPPGFKIEVHQNEINISGPAQHSHQLQRIAAQHNSATAAMNQASQSQSGNSSSSQSSAQSSAQMRTSSTSLSSQNHSSQGSGGSGSGAAASSSGGVHQPVEFNHAINYVNKIKNRFQQHPDIYKAFLEILHTYQKEQRIIKEGGTPSTTPLSESEVYSQVSKLFQNQEDLLSEFGQFLPDATSQFSAVQILGPPPPKKQALSSSSGKSSKPAHSRKSSQSGANSSGSQSKKPKSSAKEVLAEAGKHTNYAELALFDKIRKAVRSQEVYDNFMRCLILFNEEIVSRQDLVQLVTPFLGKFPELFASFKTLLGFKDPGLPEQLSTTSPAPPFPPKERVTDFAAEIDFNSLKRHGASYRALPKTYVQPKCSGRTLLCKDVLNDTWVSFPMWSEDSTFQGTRKTQYEEYIFRCEDERFELDVVLETNLSTIRIFETLQKKMAKMSPEELSKFTLDNSLGGNSDVMQRKAIHRIYGDKATDIIEGLKKSPSVAVPIVLKRLKAKQEEWQEAQRAFNKNWREQLEKYYLKSLDHQGINFKATDTRAMRSKGLIAEVETVFDERQEQMVEGASPAGPHLTFHFPEEQCVFADAVGLVTYYMKRASSLQHEEALKIRSFLTHTLADLCYYQRVTVHPEDDLSHESDSDGMDVDLHTEESDRHRSQKYSSGVLVPDTMPQFTEMDYHVVFTNNALYTFFRLFQFLCDRLNRIYQQAVRVTEEETVAKQGKAENIAVQLGLKKPPDIMVSEYYPTFLNMAKNFMEGNIDGTTYEDTCREMFGVHAYIVFTIDRLVQNTVRQLHTIVADENCHAVMEQYTSFVEQLSPCNTRMDGRTGMETAYQKKVEGLLTDENCFKIMFHKQDRKMSIELLDTDDSSEESNCPELKKWQSYVETYSKPDEEAAPELRDILAKRKVFLKRNRRAWSPSATEGGEEEEAKLVRTHLPHMEICGAIEFKMDKKYYRIIPLANSEDYLYNRGALQTAREVNKRICEQKQEKFKNWYSQWIEANISSQDQVDCMHWLLGDAVEKDKEDLLRQSTTEQYFRQDQSRHPTTSGTPATVSTA